MTVDGNIAFKINCAEKNEHNMILYFFYMIRKLTIKFLEKLMTNLCQVSENNPNKTQSTTSINKTDKLTLSKLKSLGL